MLEYVRPDAWCLPENIRLLSFSHASGREQSFTEYKTLWILSMSNRQWQAEVSFHSDTPESKNALRGLSHATL